MRHVLSAFADVQLERLTASQAKRLEIGQRIRWARKRKRMSHDTLAEKVGSSRSYLIRVEKGIHRPGLELRARIAIATDLTPDFLMDGDEDDEEAALVRDLVVLVRRIVASERRREQVDA